MVIICYKVLAGNFFAYVENDKGKRAWGDDQDSAVKALCEKYEITDPEILIGERNPQYLSLPEEKHG